MRKRLFTVLLTLCMICTLLPAQLTLAAEDTWDGKWRETNIIGFNYGDKGHLLVTMPTEPEYCIYGTTTTDAVLQVTKTQIPKNELDELPESDWNWALQKNEAEDSLPTYTLILNNATIKSSYGHALMIGNKSKETFDKMNITIEVRGENLIESNEACIDIDNLKSITIGGSGTLTLAGYLGLSSSETDSLDIIDTVTIDAKAGYCGIYSLCVSGEDITISNKAKVIANGGDDGYGIGSFTGNITILNEAKVNASGENCGILSAGNLTISGKAKVTVNANNNDTGISSARDITISGEAEVTAIGGDYGINLYYDSDGDITISGEAKVTATGGDSGIYSYDNDITILNKAKVTANGGDDGYGICSKYEGKISILDQAEVTATDGDYGIYSGGDLTISGEAKVTAIGRQYGIYANEALNISSTGDGEASIDGEASFDGQAINIKPVFGENIGFYEGDEKSKVAKWGLLVPDIKMSPEGTYTFQPVDEGYSILEPLTVTVNNNGHKEAVSLQLTQDTDSSFVLGETPLDNIAGGGSTTFTVVPTEGLTARTYTDTIKLTGDEGIDQQLQLSFTVKKPTYTITATAGQEGKIDPSGAVTVEKGGKQTFNITANSGYVIKDVKVDGVSKGSISSYTFKDINANHTLEVTFSSRGTGSSSSSGGSASTSTYGINFSKIEHGSVNLPKESVAVGEIVKFTLKADEGYEIDTLAVKDANGNSIALTQNEDGTYSFKMPSSKVTLEVTFKTAVGKSKPTTPPEETKWDNPFTDVSETSWYYEATKFVNENKLFAGTDATTFSPNVVMTREMLWTVLGRLDGEDLSGKEVFKNARTWAMSKGISDGSNPQGQITREQLVTMFWKYLGAPKAQNSDLSQFSDSDRIADYAKEAMAWAIENGIISGVGNAKLAPKEGATRAQVAVFFMNYSKLIEK